MKGKLTQYVTLGVMLLLLVLIVSLFPEQRAVKASGANASPTTVSNLTIPTHNKVVRAD